MAVLSCFDCYVFRQLGEAACWKHMTAEQRADHERRTLELAKREHPMLAMLRRSP